MKRAILVSSDGPREKGLDPVRRIFRQVSRISARREKGGAGKEGGGTPKTNNNISTEEEKADMRQSERRDGAEECLYKGVERAPVESPSLTIPAQAVYIEICIYVWRV